MCTDKKTAQQIVDALRLLTQNTRADCHGELPEVAPKQEGLPKELFAWCKQHNYPCGKQAKGECDCMLCDMVWNAALASRERVALELIDQYNSERGAIDINLVDIYEWLQSRISARSGE